MKGNTAGAVLIDEQSRIRKMQLEAVTFLWQKCTGFQLKTRYDFRGSSIDRAQMNTQETRGLEFYVDIGKRLLLIVDREPRHYKPEHMFSLDSDVVGFNLEQTYGPAASA